jgi:Enterobacterial TraT complement resistance protein
MVSVKVWLVVPGLLLGAAALQGCAATHTAVAKRNLDVQTKMTDTIFLDPVAPEQRTVYVDLRNTSDKPDFDMMPQIREAIAARGYRVVDDPRRAHYVLQANVLQAGRNSETAAEQAYSSGWGSTFWGGAAGAAVGYGLGRSGIGVNDTLGTVGGGLIGSAVSSVADAFVQDTTYSIITDIQVSERAPGQVISQTESASLAQGSSGTISQSSSTVTDSKRYRTRIMSTAERVNLDWPQAAPDLVAGMSRSIAGIF